MTCAGARGRSALVGVGAALVLAACTSAPATPSISSAAPAPDQTVTARPTGDATPTPTPEPLPPLAPGTSRGELLIVQRAEDAALVSGGEPIRVTMARTANLASWFTASPQKLAGVMSTEQALLTLGWRPSEDGTTAPLPIPRPNGLLAAASGDIAFTVQRANVRSDGTLVLDIRPIGPMPSTVESLGAVTLTLDGVPGVVSLGEQVTPDLIVRVLVSGVANQQAVVQVVDIGGQILESAYLSGDMPIVDSWVDVTSGDSLWTDPVVTFVPPGPSTPGAVTVTGTMTVDGVSASLDRVVARWSIPARDTT